MKPTHTPSKHNICWQDLLRRSEYWRWYWQPLVAMVSSRFAWSAERASLACGWLLGLREGMSLPWYSDKLSECRRLAAQQGEYWRSRSEEHTSELQSLRHLVCRLLLEKKKKKHKEKSVLK